MLNKSVRRIACQLLKHVLLYFYLKVTSSSFPVIKKEVIRLLLDILQNIMSYLGLWRNSETVLGLCPPLIFVALFVHNFLQARICAHWRTNCF